MSEPEQPEQPQHPQQAPAGAPPYAQPGAAGLPPAGQYPATSMMPGGGQHPAAAQQPYPVPGQPDGQGAAAAHAAFVLAIVYFAVWLLWQVVPRARIFPDYTTSLYVSSGLFVAIGTAALICGVIGMRTADRRTALRAAFAAGVGAISVIGFVAGWIGNLLAPVFYF